MIKVTTRKVDVASKNLNTAESITIGCDESGLKFYYFLNSSTPIHL
jgi:hypothetical protein